MRCSAASASPGSCTPIPSPGCAATASGTSSQLLIDIERSRAEPGYGGVSLHDPAQRWVYVSPISWHPDGTRALWLETPRGSEASQPIREIRLRRVRLLDGAAGAPVPVATVPDHIPYAISGDEAEVTLRRALEPTVRGRVAGRHSGYLEIERTTGDLARGKAGSNMAEFVNFSDDGKNIYNGTESVISSFLEDTVYEADLELTGPITGEMRLRATWSPLTGQEPSRLRFETASDGRPASFGFARYGEKRHEIADLLP